MTHDFKPAPELQVSQWLNTPEPISLALLRGRVVVLHAFQMLCPGCVSTGLPQASRVHTLFSQKEVVVIGLHTVFEHHAVMGADALEVFVHEYDLSFPIGIDRVSALGGTPMTMQAYGLRGTPSLVVFDREGQVRLNHFGHMDDMRLGVLLGQLVAMPVVGGLSPPKEATPHGAAGYCANNACIAPMDSGP
jgi:peroxiredoxin